ncbi:MAG: serine hydrolase domain-containing protein, partial [Gaiellales bacterium]
MPEHVPAPIRVRASVPTTGWYASGFERVAEEFADNFAERGELGAAAVAIVEGELVVDLWGGTAGDDPVGPWRADTIVNAYSVAKPLAATCVLLL